MPWLNREQRGGGHVSRELVRKDFSVFRFDYRCHGESKGDSVDMNISGEYSDLRAIVKFVLGLGYFRIILVGASFASGSIALYLSKHPEEICGLVLWNPVIDYNCFLQPTVPWAIKYFGKEAIKRIEKQGFSEVGSSKFKIGISLFKDMRTIKPWELLKDLDMPILFIHGDKDSYVPYEDSVKYSSKMQNSKLITIKDSDHGFSEKESRREAINETVKFCLERQ